MARRPAQPADYLPLVRQHAAAPVTVTYYRGHAQVSVTLADGSAQIHTVECEHLHATPEAADVCGARMTRAEQRRHREAFTPCPCHGATPSARCAEQTEPLYFWCDDEDPRAEA